MAQLFSPLKIKDIELRNRIAVSPMCEYSSTDGFATDWHLVHIGSRAVGGAALIISEAIAVSPEGRITYADLGIYKDEHIDKLKEITDFVHQHGAYMGLQLAHAGRKASHERPWDERGKQILPDYANGWETVSASAVPFIPEEVAPIALDKAGIEKVKADFKAATERALKVGIDVIELHAAHGYLLHQFYSPLSNQRTDEYGGSFENRIRLLLEVVDSVKQVWPDEKPLFVRISATDWTEGGWTIEDSVKLATVLKEKGVDLIDTSTGGNVLAKIPLKPGYQIEFAEQIKKESGIMTGAVGLITESKQANEIIETEQADLVFIARELLRDPYFPLRAAHELGQDITWPVQYERAKWH
ncbi:NADPH dehydrogenase NamA [Mucilaginibacter sp. KACC 22063]|uniref:NADPH dehydrogenase NamA n=1 Tax=Mucilaginibacter sp. KACC 22063 TaxID=3025666 RepID=UPI00236581E5|nr:NADPH dehydrogenase NamA [Mucilaginibacter sp. KACC 22063]WDF54552.1 NADPH dehydrogenase NamA [Mucilaginibacter sp. KACC 22063]